MTFFTSELLLTALVINSCTSYTEPCKSLSTIVTNLINMILILIMAICDFFSIFELCCRLRWLESWEMKEKKRLIDTPHRANYKEHFSCCKKQNYFRIIKNINSLKITLFSHLQVFILKLTYTSSSKALHPSQA